MLRHWKAHKAIVLNDDWSFHNLKCGYKMNIFHFIFFLRKDAIASPVFFAFYSNFIHFFPFSLSSLYFLSFFFYHLFVLMPLMFRPFLLFLFIIWSRISFTPRLKLTLNLWLSCLSLLSNGMMKMNHHACVISISTGSFPVSTFISGITFSSSVKNSIANSFLSSHFMMITIYL